MDIETPTVDDTAPIEWTFSHSFPLPYRVLLILIGGLWAWGSNIQILSLFGVDVPTLLSFPYNPEKTSRATYKSVYSLAMIFTVWVFFNLMLFWWVTGGDPSLIRDWTSIPLLCYAVVIGIILCPFNTLRQKDRAKFMRSLRQIAFFKFGTEVHFADVILADMLMSFAKVFGDLYVTGCILLFHNFEEAGIFGENRCWSYVIAPLFTSIPYIIRVRQCTSEYWRSNFNDRYHLLNALKYASAFPVILLSALQKRPDYDVFVDEVTFGQVTLFNLWILSVAINSMYSFYWDVAKDWDLEFFSPRGDKTTCRYIPSFKLRPILCFQEPIIYYLAILIDFILRFTWSLKLSSHLHVVAELEAGVFLMESLEVLRRWIWMFFRMERTLIQKSGAYALMNGNSTNLGVKIG